MADILVINSSAARGGSVSRILVDHAIDLLVDADPGAVVVHRDLGSNPMPHLTSDNLAGVRGIPGSEAEHAARALSDALIAEVRAAETIVIGAPMYNFSIPTGLRAWFDHVLRAGETFRYSEAGPQGLLAGKRVVISTGTLNLQDQLFHRDLPRVREALGVPVRVALLKGRANYLCRQRLARAAQQPAARGEVVKLRQLQEWLPRTECGEVQESGVLAEDDALLPRVTSTAENCLGSACPDFEDCFVVKARRNALAADIAAHAPLTIRATKEAVRRIQEHRRIPPALDDDLITLCYTSDDFKEGVAAFLARRPPQFRGR